MQKPNGQASDLVASQNKKPKAISDRGLHATRLSTRRWVIQLFRLNHGRNRTVFHASCQETLLLVFLFPAVASVFCERRTGAFVLPMPTCLNIM